MPLSWEECKVEIAKEKAFLDTLDFLPIFKTIATEAWTVADYVRYIEEHYINEYNEWYPDAEFIMNCMTNEEFAQYIQDRYGIRCIERTEYYFDI